MIKESNSYPIKCQDIYRIDDICILFGPTKYILSMTTESMGFHLDNYFTQATYLGTFEGEQWPIW
ncbi:protein of unknown function [[Clostridium] ultunense Esp]|uniref:Uncharacterized protein n=1 Tax=[Clostridium] ultunense Esp TaxID=1288971 RepID=A0A1M4PLP3_9FIRM|nr:protein of unknown function [[Clostridium] ultunense Esp]